MNRPLALLAAIAILVISMTSIAEAQVSQSTLDGIDRLRQATAAHPEDPDLAWAYARKLSAAGQVDSAVRVARDFLARWPDHRPGARVEIARSLIDADAAPAAAKFLDEEVHLRPTSGIARFYRALVLRETAKIAAADQEFALAARLEPALRSESLLARAVGLFEMGQDDAAVDLLVEILETDPTSDAAIRARLLLRQKDLPISSARLRADGYVGFEFDDNVTLASSENETPASDQQDFRGIWGVGGSYRTLLREDALLLVGYRFDQTEQHDLNAFSLLSNTLFVSGIWKSSERVALRMDVIASNTLQDLDNELTNASVRPSLVVSHGKNWGVSRILAEFDVAEYDTRSVLEPFERDSLAYTLGLEHNLPLRLENSFVSFSGTWQRTLTQAEPDGGPNGFDGDFDSDSWRARAAARLGLPFGLRTRIDLSYTHDRYHNDNFAHAFTTGGARRKRRDDILNGRIRLNGPLIPHVRWEVYWSGTRRISNVDLFDYDKQVFGALLRVSTVR